MGKSSPDLLIILCKWTEKCPSLFKGEGEHIEIQT